MKQYIKTVAMTLVAGLGLVACNDNEDFDKYQVTYPSEMPVGYFATENAPNSDYNYGVVIRTSETDTTFQVIREGKSGYYARTIASAGSVSYDSKLGMVKASCPADENYHEQDLDFYLAYTADCKSLMLSYKEGNKMNTAILSKSSALPPVAGNWACEKDGLSISVELLTDSVFNDAKQFIGWKANMSLNGAEAVPFAYNLEGENGGKFDFNGIPGTFKYDANYNLVVTAIGQNFVCERSASKPEPEVFTEIGYGKVAHGLQVIQGGGVFNDQYEAAWSQSEKDPNRFLISPWLDNGNGIVVVINPANKVVSFEKTTTGRIHPQFGEIFSEDAGSMINFGDGGDPRVFDGKTVNLFVMYSCAEGSFGITWDSFTLIGPLTGADAKTYTYSNGKVTEVK